MVYIDFIVFIISLIAIVIGAEFLVNSSSKIAKRLGTSDFIIGMTLVSIGTSLPELSIAISASLKGEGIISIGNLVGASITNLSLILGLGMIISTIKIRGTVFNRDSWILLLTTITFLLFSLDKNISRLEGIILLLVFFYYLYDLSKNTHIDKKLLYHSKLFDHKEINLPFELIMTLIGIAMLYFGAKYLIPATVNISVFLKIPEEIISLTLISIGTTLPELTVTIVAVSKKLTNLYLGNLVGSNITNLMLIVGIVSAINPVNISKVILVYMVPFLLIMSVLFILFYRITWINERIKGILLLFFYIIFIITLLILRIW